MDSPGSKGTAHVERDRWELRGPNASGVVPRHCVGIHNRASAWVRKSDGAVVAMKRGNARGAKGPCRYHADAGRRRTPLAGLSCDYGRTQRSARRSLRSTRRVCPVKVFLLRQKLYRKSKQEPNIVRGPAKDCGRQISRKPDAGNLPVRFDEGGLNLRNHGSSAAARLSPLLYRFSPVVTACKMIY